MRAARVCSSGLSLGQCSGPVLLNPCPFEGRTDGTGWGWSGEEPVPSAAPACRGVGWRAGFSYQSRDRRSLKLGAGQPVGETEKQRAPTQAKGQSRGRNGAKAEEAWPALGAQVPARRSSLPSPTHRLWDWGSGCRLVAAVAAVAAAAAVWVRGRLGQSIRRKAGAGGPDDGPPRPALLP